MVGQIMAQFGTDLHTKKWTPKYRNFVFLTNRQKPRQKFKLEALNLSIEMGSRVAAAMAIGVSAKNLRR
jgi:hypothetical protein